MNREQFYQWQGEIRRRLGVTKWQSLGLALFSLGVVWAERCTVSKVAERLAGMWGSMESVERRLQRVLSNGKVELRECGVRWVRWVMSVYDSTDVVLLVDETKLGAHLSVMMVGLAYAGRCIPLAWRCYRADAYPAEGQVNLIARLLRQVKQGLPAACCPLVQADRGIGTSPALMRVVKRLKWRFLFRVQGQTKVCTYRGQEYPLDQQPPGWSANGYVFKQRGRIRAYAFVHRAWPHRETWCLVTNDPFLCPQDYALRAWQEHAFRDLKSGGWAWQRSQVWHPDHAERLILVLALAYARMLTLGTFVAAAQPAVRARICRGSRRLFSCFREGLRYFWDCLSRAIPVYPGLFFAPNKLLS